MAKVYARLILRGLKTLAEVPEQLRAEVQALLAAAQGAGAQA